MPKMIIDLPDSMYNKIKRGLWCGSQTIKTAVLNGTVLPEKSGNYCPLCGVPKQEFFGGKKE